MPDQSNSPVPATLTPALSEKPSSHEGLSSPPGRNRDAFVLMTTPSPNPCKAGPVQETGGRGILQIAARLRRHENGWAVGGMFFRARTPLRMTLGAILWTPHVKNHRGRSRAGIWLRYPVSPEMAFLKILPGFFACLITMLRFCCRAG